MWRRLTLRPPAVTCTQMLSQPTDMGQYATRLVLILQREHADRGGVLLVGGDAHADSSGDRGTGNDGGDVGKHFGRKKGGYRAGLL